MVTKHFKNYQLLSIEDAKRTPFDLSESDIKVINTSQENLDEDEVK